MKMSVTFLALFCLFISSVYCDADKCPADGCSNNCQCSTTKPILAEGEAPQLIALTFDEAIVDNLYTSVWEPLLFERKNPDGNPISATFFVPHEYTDYRRVQDLYLKGFEIGVNSITKNSSSEYWSTASEDTLKSEFGGQRVLVSHFAKIPQDDIVGVRTPQLQLEGDVSINAYTASDLQYDSSWTSRSTQMFFPYTLDYLSTQECRSGTTCPKESHEGFWIAPIIDLQGNSTDGSVLECNSLIGCNVQGSAGEIADWLAGQVERERSGNRAPLTLMVGSAWFRFANNSLEGFQQFLDNMLGLGDVYLVSQKQIVDWTRNPVPASEFKTDVPERSADCNPINCALKNSNGELRYMMSCVGCPDVYPWLGNPLGQTDPDHTTTTEKSTVTTDTTTPHTTTTPTTPTTTTPTPTPTTSTTPPPEILSD